MVCICNALFIKNSLQQKIGHNVLFSEILVDTWVLIVPVFSCMFEVFHNKNTCI